jgi:hypothetical protein
MSVARLYRVGSPYNAVDLPEVDFEQSADTMYLAHLNYAPTKLIRYAHDHWEFVTIAFGPTIAAPAAPTVTVNDPNQGSEPGDFAPTFQRYAVTTIDDDSGQESRASASTQVNNDLTLKGNNNFLTWPVVSGADRYRVFRSDNQQDFGYIGTTISAAFTDDNIGPDLTDTPPVGDNPFTGQGNNPSTVTFFEQRLMYGRSLNRPNAVWGSRVGDFENFDISRPLKASDALSFALVAGRVNAVNQLVSVSELLALTSDSVFKITGGGNGDSLTPTQIVSRRQVGRGSSRLGPIVCDNVVFYRPSVGSSVRALGYSFEQDGFQSNDVTIFSPHLFEDIDIVGWAYAQEPRSILWAWGSDGLLRAFTWEQEQQVWGWTLCDVGGFVESGCVISEQAVSGRIEDRLYLAVRRTIGGVEKRYIERMAAAYWDEVDDGCFVDCGVTYRFDEPTPILTGLDHLEGETLSALADGNVVEGLVVEAGSVTLPNPALRVTIGLPYTALLETLPLSTQTQQGSVVARKSTTAEAVVRVVKSRGIWAGPTEEKQYEVKPRTNEDLGAPAALKTGNYLLASAPVTKDEVSFVVTAPYPLPASISAIYLDPVIAD